MEIVSSFYLDLITYLALLGVEEMLTLLLFLEGVSLCEMKVYFLLKSSKGFNGYGPMVFVYGKKRKLLRGGLLGKEKTLTRGVSLDREKILEEE